jgi:GNAT superfamily N-acetyltransferase
MTPTSDMEVVSEVTDENGVERVNAFFNSKAIKQALHRFTYSTTLERAFEREDRRLFYIERDGDIVAALMVWCESRVLDADEAQIRLVAVAGDYRNQGIAKRLCQRAEQFARDYGKSKVSADVAKESAALGFWKACNYKIARVWETDNGREMCRMEKKL